MLFSADELTYFKSTCVDGTCKTGYLTAQHQVYRLIGLDFIKSTISGKVSVTRALGNFWFEKNTFWDIIYTGFENFHKAANMNLFIENSFREHLAVPRDWSAFAGYVSLRVPNGHTIEILEGIAKSHPSYSKDDPLKRGARARSLSGGAVQFYVKLDTDNHASWVTPPLPLRLQSATA